jgi:hypothetical protein
MTRVFYQDLEHLTLPWLTPRALEKADREILSNLLNRCRQAERSLGGRNRAEAAIRRAIIMVASSVALVLTTWIGGQRWPPVLDRVRGWSDLAWFSLKHSGAVSQLFVFSLVVVGVSAYVVSRAARE